MHTHDKSDGMISDISLPENPTPRKTVGQRRQDAAAMLGQIVQQVEQALKDGGIGITLFFAVPSSGDAFLTFGTTADPLDAEWKAASYIVSAIVERSLGIEGTQCRDLVCAMFVGGRKPDEESA